MTFAEAKAQLGQKVYRFDSKFGQVICARVKEIAMTNKGERVRFSEPGMVSRLEELRATAEEAWLDGALYYESKAQECRENSHKAPETGIVKERKPPAKTKRKRGHWAA